MNRPDHEAAKTASKTTQQAKYTDEYSALPEFTRFRDGFLPGSFQVPESWAIAVTDVIDSTNAVREGRYKDVNIAGALPIIAIARLYGTLKRPFVFGGDGMTFLLDPQHKSQAEMLLSRVIRDIEQFFSIRIRAAIIPVSRIRAEGGDISVSKMRVSENYVQAFFQGSGLAMAEEILKHPRPEDSPYFLRKAEDSEPVNYEGFSCRWQDIPSTQGISAALIVVPRTGDPLAVLDNVEEILGDSDNHHPIEIQAMRLGGPDSGWKNEHIVKYRAKKSLAYKFSLLGGALRIFIVNLVSALKLKITHSIYRLGEIREQNKANADFRKFDGSLKMIFSASPALTDELQHRLHLLFEKGLLYYGLHRARGAHMTCLASVETGDDLHFIDATDGGYSFAAAQLKQQMRTGIDSDYQDRFGRARETGASQDPWAEFAEDYEEIFPLGKEARGFFSRMISTDSRPITKIPKTHLDLGCASGQLSRFFTEQGWESTGIDSSPRFIEKAKQLAGDAELAELAELAERFRVGSIFEAATFDSEQGRTYSIITCLGNTIVHAPSLAAVAELLRACRGLLSEGGLLILGLLNYDGLLPNISKPGTIFPIISSNGRVFEREYRPSEKDGYLDFTISFSKFGSRVFTETIEHFPLQSRDLGRLVREAGFSKVEWYSDYLGTAIETDSSMVLALISV